MEFYVTPNSMPLQSDYIKAMKSTIAGLQRVQDRDDDGGVFGILDQASCAWMRVRGGGGKLIEGMRLMNGGLCWQRRIYEK